MFILYIVRILLVSRRLYGLSIQGIAAFSSSSRLWNKNHSFRLFCNLLRPIKPVHLLVVDVV